MPISLMISTLRMGRDGHQILEILDALTADLDGVESDTDSVDTVVKQR